MKRTIWTFACLSMLLASCNSLTDNPTDGTGELLLRIETSDETSSVPVRSGSLELNVDEFNVEIYNSSGLRLYNKPYAEASQSGIKLNAGDYTLVASYGDSLGVGFDAVYFGAKEEFTVRPQTSETLEVVCRQANVKAEVKYGPYILSDHPDVYSKLVRDENHILTFANGEERAGYIPGGMLVLEIYATIDGNLKMFRTNPIECLPNDYVKFNVELAGEEDAGITVNITVDSSTEDKEYEQTIPVTMTPDEEPAVIVNGFEEGNVLSVIEGLESSESQIQIYAPAGIRECVLNVESAALQAMGVPSSVNLAESDKSVMKLLSDAGLFVSADVEGKNFAYISFAEFTRKMKTIDGDNRSVFSLSVTDAKDRQAESGSYGYEIVPVELTMQPVSDGDSWATSVRNLKVASEYDHVKVSLQYSSDGGVQWSTVREGMTAGHDGYYTLSSVSGLKPSTDYMIRAIYNDNLSTATDAVSFRTEDALQLGNSSFEEYSQKEVKAYYTIWSYVTRIAYFPYSNIENRWWDCNTLKTMLTDITVSNYDYKCTPMVVPSEDAYKGERSIQISTISVNGWNTSGTSLGTPVAGELYIGASNENGDRVSEGHAFASRPLSMTFNYKFVPYGDESFYAQIKILAADGTVIGEGVVDNMPAQPQWSEYTCKINYTDMQKTAATVFVIFKSSSASSPGINKDMPYQINGAEQRAHLGSMLTVDDVRLNY